MVSPGQRAACGAALRPAAPQGWHGGRVGTRRLDAQAAVELDRAAIVGGIGMGLGDRHNIDRLQPLIDLLHASVCITRDVSEAGWLPTQHQVGMTGRAIAAARVEMGCARRSPAFCSSAFLREFAVWSNLTKWRRLPR